MKATIDRLLLLIVLFSLSGCMVVTENPVGTEAYSIKPEYLDGAWIGGHNIYFVDASKSMDGVLKVSTVGKQSGEYALTQFTVQLRQGEKHIYANVRTNVFIEKGTYKGPAGWFCFIAEETDDGYQLLYPDRQAIAGLLLEGEIEGKQAPQPYVTLTGDSEALTELYESGRLPMDVFEELQHHVISMEKVSLNIERDLMQYATILAKWKERGMAGHFPDAIPEGAEDASLSAFGGFMQAGAWFQLYIVLPKDEAQALYDEMLTQAIAYEDGSGHQTILKPKLSFGSDIPGTAFHTSKNLYYFTEDFRTFILAAKPYKTEPVDWNHGYSEGLVINRGTGEVIFFVEDW